MTSPHAASHRLGYVTDWATDQAPRVAVRACLSRSRRPMRVASGILSLFVAAADGAGAQPTILPSNLKIARALPADDQTTKPASFSVISGESGWTTAFDGAAYLQWDVLGTHIASVGVAATLGSSRNEDARVVTPVLNVAGPVGRVYVVTGSSLEANSKLTTRTLVGTALLTATRVRSIALGEDRDLSNRLIIRWRPYVGLEAGRILRVDADEVAPEGDKGTDIARGVARTDVRLRFVRWTTDTTGQRRVADVVRLSGSATSRYSNRADRWFSVATTSLAYVITPTYSVVLAYDVGRKPPIFGRQEVLALGLGIER